MSDEHAGRQEGWEKVRDAAKRAEAVAEIPFVIWSAGSGPVPTRVDTGVPGQQRIEWQVPTPTEAERVQHEQKDWAHHEEQQLEQENARAVDHARAEARARQERQRRDEARARTHDRTRGRQ